MKIGFFTDSYLPMPDGVATSVDACVRALEKKGHEVYVVAPKYPGHKDKTKNVYRLTSMKVVRDLEVRWALQLPEKPLLQILRIDFDIIHGHSGGGIMFLGLQVARAKNIPYVVTHHTFWTHYTHYIFKGKIIRPRMIKVATKWFCNLCDCLIAPTEIVKKELISYGVKKPIEIIQNGIDLDEFSIKNKGFVRKKENIPNDVKILLYIGRLSKEKSVEFLLHSFKLVHAKDSKTALVLVGYGPEKQKLENLAKKLEIDKSVYFFGTIEHSNIGHVYADAELFVFASQTETQGMVILESFASKVPVIAVKDKAFEDIIIDGKNGYLVKKDAKIFAIKVTKLLNDRKLYNKFSQEARKSAENFSVQMTASSLEALYERFVKKQRQKEKTGAKKLLNKLKKIYIKISIPQELVD